MHAILLAGAAVVGLPILLHLIMKQEPKRLPFPALRFLLERKKTNQRKMRLRHFLLLALRVLLLALFCAALYQPTISGDFRLANLSGERPIAAVLIIDNSPSMGYRQGNVSRLEEARRRAVEFLDTLPVGSKVAVLDPLDPLGNWENSTTDARKRIDAMKEPAGSASPVTSVLGVAYRLLRTADEDNTDPRDAFPRVVAVFSDRTTNCWETARFEELKKLRDAVPNSDQKAAKPVHFFVDVGSDTPTNVSIMAADIRPQLLSGGAPAAATVTLQATGGDVPNSEISSWLDAAGAPEKMERTLVDGSPASVRFNFDRPKPGFHQARFRIRDDSLAIDNERYLTFAVAAPRKLLTVADDPFDAAFWRVAHRTQQEFECDVVTPAAVDSFAGYDAVCMINVADPNVATKSGKPLWDALKEYAENGGRLMIAPGPLGPNQIGNYNNPASAKAIMPATLNQVKDWSLVPAPKPPADPKAPSLPDRRFGVTWKIDTPQDTSHPMLAPFNEWRLKGNVNVLRNPRPASRYWLATPAEGASTVVDYDDAEPAEPEKRNPAIIEKAVAGGRVRGTVLLLTTRLDPQEDAGSRWNEYWATTDSAWPVVFPNLLARYLAGSPDDAVYNFATGQDVTVPLPSPVPGKKRTIVLEGPGISGRDAFPEIPDTQTEFRWPRERTTSPGQFTIRTDDRSWEYRFSVNVPAEEFVLEKVPEAAIEELFGPKSVIPLGKGVALTDAAQTQYTAPIDLFPWLLFAVLILFVMEGFLANRFDSRSRTTT